MTYAGHYQGDITLGLDGEVLHEGNKGWPGCYLDTAIDLEVQEVGAVEYMIFICDVYGGAVDCAGCNLYVVEDTQGVVSPGELGGEGYSLLKEEGFGDEWWGVQAAEVRHII